MWSRGTIIPESEPYRKYDEHIPKIESCRLMGSIRIDQSVTNSRDEVIKEDTVRKKTTNHPGDCCNSLTSPLRGFISGVVSLS